MRNTFPSAVARVLHDVLDASGGTWTGSATALHDLLTQTAHGPDLRAMPLTPTALTRVLTELIDTGETEYGLRAVREGRSRWVLSVATPHLDDLDDLDDDWVL
jgi:hypothetical protein